MASYSDDYKSQTMTNLQPSPSPSPFSTSSSNSPNKAPPAIRKLGPSMAPQRREGRRKSNIPSHKRTSVEASGINNGGIFGSHDSHHSVDKSIAGGGVILGGLATTFLVAVICYIRATRRHKAETTTTTTA